MATFVKPTKSTTVRPKDLRMTIVHTAFGVLDRIAPAFAGRWALRIWCTLPTSSGRRQDNRLFPGTRSYTELPDGRRVAVEVWEPTDAPGAATVYLVHGWGGWRGQLGAFVPPLLAAGRRVVAFDAPGHGESGPSNLGPGRATGIDFADALTAVVADHGAAAGIVAHSLGCATTTMALRDGLTAGRLAFVAPGPDPVGTTNQLQRVLGYGARSRRHFFARLSRLANRPLEDLNALTISADDDVPPALVVHDREDKESPYEDGARLAETWPESELLTTEGLGHQRILIDDGVVKAVADYLGT